METYFRNHAGQAMSSSVENVWKQIPESRQISFSVFQYEVICNPTLFCVSPVYMNLLHICQWLASLAFMSRLVSTVNMLQLSFENDFSVTSNQVTQPYGLSCTCRIIFGDTIFFSWMHIVLKKITKSYGNMA